MQIIPDEYLYHAHHWLILHGRYCCKARKPDCQACVIADICKSAEKTNEIPAELKELPEQLFAEPKALA
jgi:endonuclease III